MQVEKALPMSRHIWKCSAKLSSFQNALEFTFYGGCEPPNNFGNFGLSSPLKQRVFGESATSSLRDKTMPSMLRPNK